MNGSNDMWGGAVRIRGLARSCAKSMPPFRSTKRFGGRMFAPARPMSPCWRRRASSRSRTPRQLQTGLDSIAAEYERDGVPEDWALEDIHMTVEARLTEMIGPVAGRLHTARSRNDQVATDFKLWVPRCAGSDGSWIAGISAGAGSAALTNTLRQSSPALPIYRRRSRSHSGIT